MMPDLGTAVGWNAAPTWFMTGVIWFVQLVHYPLMARVGEAKWREYESAHQRRTTWIVAPTMLLEVITAVLVLVVMHTGDSAVGRAGGDMVAAAWVAAGLLVVIWASTFLLQVPYHARLGAGFDQRVHRALVRSNWIRTAAWSGRSLILLMMMR